MTLPEFKAWLAFHRVAFPEVGTWLNADRTPDEIQALLSMWAEAMSRVDFGAAKSCTMRMVRGDVQHPSRFEISRLPAAVIQSCPQALPTAAELAGKQYNPHTGEIV